MQALLILLVFAGVGTIYLLRTGDRMLDVSALELGARNWLEETVLYRPRIKEFLVAWPAMALAFCFAGRNHRLPAWLFGTLGSVGFASVANTFCHIRAHFLISLARTALGLALGLILGEFLLALFRPHSVPDGKDGTIC